MKQFKKIIFNLCLLLILAMGLLFTGEAVVRILCNNDSSILIPDPLFHHVHNKHFRGRRKGPKNQYNVMVKFNSYGYRDYEYSFKKPENTSRIIILGDSFVDALEVELEETFVKRLEKRLNKTSPTQSRYEVLNLGTQGYSTILEYLVLKKIGLKFNPDRIITFFHFTDISEVYTHSQLMVSDKDGLPVCVPSEFLSQGHINFWGKDFLRVHSRLYTLVRSQYHKLIKTELRKKTSAVLPPPDYYEVFKPDYSTKLELAWGLIDKCLLGMKSLADTSGGKFVLVIIPAPNQVAVYEAGKKGWGSEGNSFISSTKMQDRLIKFCRENGIEVIDLLPVLRRLSRSESPLFFVYDNHFTKRGHLIVSEVIYNYLLTNKLVSP